MAKKNALANVKEMATIRGTAKLIKEYQDLAELEDLINKRKEEIKQVVKDKMKANHFTEIKAGDFKVTLQESHNHGSINKEMLKAKYPEIYEEFYKAPKTEISEKFIVKAFTKSKVKTTPEMLNGLMIALNKPTKA